MVEQLYQVNPSVENNVLKVGFEGLEGHGTKKKILHSYLGFSNAQHGTQRENRTWQTKPFGNSMGEKKQKIHPSHEPAKFPFLSTTGNIIRVASKISYFITLRWGNLTFWAARVNILQPWLVCTPRVFILFPSNFCHL